MVGNKKPLVVELTSNAADEFGATVPIPILDPLLKILELFNTHCVPSQYGVFPAAEPLANNPAGPCGPVGPAGPVAPVNPVGPVGPAGPWGPVAPVAQAKPCGPVGPTGPTNETPAGHVPFALGP